VTAAWHARVTGRATLTAIAFLGGALLYAGAVSEAGPWKGDTRVLIAHGRRPGGGSFSFVATRSERSGGARYCYQLERRRPRGARPRAYTLGGCLDGVPARRALVGRAAYSCYTRELEVAGGVTARAARVEALMSHGRRAEARLYRSPHRLGFNGRFFGLFVRTGARYVDDMHPSKLRAYNASGAIIGTQTFPRGSASSFGCYSPPPVP